MQVKNKPNAGMGPAKDWVADASWLNVVNLSTKLPIFRELPDSMLRGDAIWRQWYDHEAPETAKIPVSHATLNAPARTRQRMSRCHISYGILVMAHQFWHISYGILVMAY